MITTLLAGQGALLIARMALAGEINKAHANDVIDGALLELDTALHRITPIPQALQWGLDGYLFPRPSDAVAAAYLDAEAAYRDAIRADWESPSQPTD